MSGVVRWVAKLSCDHVTGGSCAEEFLPRVNDELHAVICRPCSVARKEPRSVIIVDIVDSRPLRVGTPEA